MATGGAADEIKAGLEDAIAFAGGDSTAGKAHPSEKAPLDVRSLRDSLGMTQDQFARTMMVSLPTVRNWEKGRHLPRGPARVLLELLQREPMAVLRVLCGDDG